MGALRPRADLTIADAARQLATTSPRRPDRHGPRRARRAPTPCAPPAGPCSRGPRRLRRLRDAARGHEAGLADAVLPLDELPDATSGSDAADDRRRRVHRRSAAACAPVPASTSSSTSAARWSGASAPSTATRGAGRLRGYLRLMAATAATLDAFLDRVTINVSELYRNPEQCDALATKVLPELAAPAARIRDLERGLLLRRRGLHARRLVGRGPAGPRASRSPGSDIDRRIVERAREGRFSQADMRNVPPAALRALLQARRRRLARDHALRRACPLPRRGPAARPLPDGPRPRALPQRRHLLQRRRAATTCTPASPEPAARRLLHGRRHRARRRPGRAGPAPAAPFIYRREG